jgi:hypothetical protein
MSDGPPRSSNSFGFDSRPTIVCSHGGRRDQGAFCEQKKTRHVLFALLAVVVVCGDGRSSTPPTSLPTSPTPPTTGFQPVIAGITPSVGSDRGGGRVTIAGPISWPERS